ncbi:CLUMA_CG007666, isoform A [Clunio marinus]|uniref:CLUMA_CG007666, isoform A n=1 Tax=Clunio marinus TaxID=568069 RepID=A0A1J1I1Q8_9DIPT|nr:CLUMA_CG007666, isoform A [Clunio marinus]
MGEAVTHDIAFWKRKENVTRNACDLKNSSTQQQTVWSSLRIPYKISLVHSSVSLSTKKEIFVDVYMKSKTDSTGGHIKKVVLESIEDMCDTNISTFEFNVHINAENCHMNSSKS